MKISHLSLIIVLSFGLVGCETTATSQPGAIAVYGQGSQIVAYGFSCYVLSKSKGDDLDLAEKKEILNDVVKYLTIARDQGFTGAQVGSGLLDQVPASKEHWRSFVGALKTGIKYATGPEAVSVITGFINGINQALAAFQ